jgi:hypothetical protein
VRRQKMMNNNHILRINSRLTNKHDNSKTSNRADPIPDLLYSTVSYTAFFSFLLLCLRATSYDIVLPINIISYHILSLHNISYHILSEHILSHHSKQLFTSRHLFPAFEISISFRIRHIHVSLQESISLNSISSLTESILESESLI